MKSITNYLDELKEMNGSDYETANRLKCDRSVIANIRKRGMISDETAVKIADELKIDRSELLLVAAIARSNEEIKKTWLKISEKILASLIYLAVLNANIPQAEASNNMHYTKLRDRRRATRYY